MTLRFVSLKDVGFFLSNLDSAIQEREDFEDNININIDASASFAAEEKTIIFLIDLSYAFDIPGEDEQFLLLKYTARVTLRLENFDEVFLKKEDGGYIVHNQVGVTLIGICLSTIRGVLIEKTANSPMSQYPLPVIDPKIIKQISGLETAA